MEVAWYAKVDLQGLRCSPDSKLQEIEHVPK